MHKGEYGGKKKKKKRRQKKKNSCPGLPKIMKNMKNMEMKRKIESKTYPPPQIRIGKMNTKFINNTQNRSCRGAKDIMPIKGNKREEVLK